MSPCLHWVRAQSFQNFLRKAILRFLDQLFSTWSVQNSRTIRHLRYAPRSKSTSQRKNLCRVGVLNWQWSRYADWWIWIDAHTSSTFGREFTALFICTSSINNKKLMLRFQSTTASLTQSGLPVSRLVFIIIFICNFLIWGCCAHA